MPKQPDYNVVQNEWKRYNSSFLPVRIVSVMQCNANLCTDWKCGNQLTTVTPPHLKITRLVHSLHNNHWNYSKYYTHVNTTISVAIFQVYEVYPKVSNAIFVGWSNSIFTGQMPFLALSQGCQMLLKNPTNSAHKNCPKPAHWNPVTIIHC